MTASRLGHATSAILCTLAACALALLATAYTPLNTDLGWILDYGRHAFHEGRLPATNGRSFIEPDHPLILHEWATCLLFYALHARWGAAGLIALRWACLAATLTLMSMTICRITIRPLSRLVTLLAAAQTLAGGLQLLRPQLLSLVLLAAIVFLGLFAGRRTLWVAIPLFALWANLHGGWLAGIVALTACCGTRLIAQRWSQERTPGAVLLAVPCAATAALLLNPWGPQLLVHTLHHASDDVRLFNQEWTPLWHAGPLASWEKIALLELSGSLFFVAMTVPRRELALWALLLLGVAAGFSANRNLRIAPVLILPAVACGLGRLEAMLGESLQRGLERWIPAVAGLLCVAFAGPLVSGGSRLFRLVDYPPPNPGSAIWVMEKNHLSGKLWSDFNWGGTLLWTLPDIQIGCDGRNVAAYSVPTLRASMRFGEARDPAGLLERYGADMVLLAKDSVQLAALRETYPPIYCDDQVCLLSRRPDQQRQAREGLILPPRPVLVSELLDPPRAEEAVPAHP